MLAERSLGELISEVNQRPCCYLSLLVAAGSKRTCTAAETQWPPGHAVIQTAESFLSIKHSSVWTKLTRLSRLVCVFLHLCLCLSTYVCVSLSVWLCVCIPVSVSMYLCVSVCVFVYVFMSVFLCMSVHMFVCVCVFVSLCVCMSVCLFV